MPKKTGRKRSKGTYIRGVVDEELSLGTLAAKTLVADTWDQSATEKTLISSVVATFSVDDLLAPQGPLLFGIAHSDYTDAEIEEVIENTGSWNRGDKIAQERAKRLVRVIGQFVGQEPSAAVADVRFNDGKPVKIKLNWSLQTGQTLKMWCYNLSDTALVTSVPTMHANGHANLWQR